MTRSRRTKRTKLLKKKKKNPRNAMLTLTVDFFLKTF